MTDETTVGGFLLLFPNLLIMSLSILSIEIVLLIFEFATNSALLSLSRTCRGIHNLAEAELDDRRRVRHYKWTYLASTEYGTNRATHAWTHPIEAICELEADPKAADCVETIQYHAGSYLEGANMETLQHHAGRYVEELATAYPEIFGKIKTADCLRDHIERFSFLSCDEKKQWKNNIERGDLDPAFSVLFSMCRNATQLVLCNLWFPDEDFASVVRYLWTQHDPSIRDHYQINHLFPCITSLIFAWWDTEGGESLDCLLPILLIPTLRQFDGDRVGGEGEPGNALTWPADAPVRCQLELVRLANCYIHPPDLKTLIEGMPNLEKLDYGDYFDFQCGYYEDDNNQSYESTSMEEYLDKLREYCGLMLEERGLVLTMIAKYRLICVRKQRVGEEPEVITRTLRLKYPRPYSNSYEDNQGE